MTKETKKKEKEEKKENKKTYYAYPEAKVVCSCGNVLKTGSTEKEMHVEICSACHPFYTGSQKVIDTGGRIEKFQKRMAKKDELAKKSSSSKASEKKEKVKKTK
jgi:large subunit ribosomal protein L31